MEGDSEQLGNQKFVLGCPGKACQPSGFAAFPERTSLKKREFISKAILQFALREFNKFHFHLSKISNKNLINIYQIDSKKFVDLFSTFLTDALIIAQGFGKSKSLILILEYFH